MSNCSDYYNETTNRHLTLKSSICSVQIRRKVKYRLSVSKDYSCRFKVNCNSVVEQVLPLNFGLLKACWFRLREFTATTKFTWSLHLLTPTIESIPSRPPNSAQKRSIPKTLLVLLLPEFNWNFQIKAKLYTKIFIHKNTVHN